MKNQTHSMRDDFRKLVVDAEELLSATADVSTKTVAESRQRLTNTLEKGKKLYGEFTEKTYEGALAADEVATKYVYHAAGIVIGAFFGFFAVHRFTCKRSN